MYQAVINGTCVACFEDFAVGNYAIKNDNLDLRVVEDIGENGCINPYPYGFAVKKGENEELVKMFNRGLHNIKIDGTYDKILEKYGL